MENGPDKPLRGIRKEAPVASAGAGVSHLLVIAIDEYRRLPRLNNCVRDARGLLEVLRRRYAFTAERTTTLFDGEATGEAIVRCLEALPGQVAADDNLLIIFSGHGEYRSPQEEGFWVPVDARPDVTKDRLSVPELKMYLNAVTCRHLVLIVDACFSGSVFRRYRSTSSPTLAEPSRWGLTSGRLEPVLDGHPGMHSPFAESLLRQLKTAAEPLRIDQLHARIVDDLQQMGFAEQAPDCGYLDLSGNRRGMFVFTPQVTSGVPGPTVEVEVRLHGSTFRITEGDIVEARADAVVSSDDTRLSMSGGVSAAISRAAGPALRDFIHRSVKRPVRIGEVMPTAAFSLPANYIFHAVTLDHDSQAYAADDAIAAMTRRCLELADERQLLHIVFPAIGTGSAGAPFESTARAMIDTICAYLARGSSIESVTIILHRGASPARKAGLQTFYQRALQEGAAWSKLARHLEELPGLLGAVGKAEWVDEMEKLREKILGGKGGTIDGLTG